MAEARMAQCSPRARPGEERVLSIESQRTNGAVDDFGVDLDVAVIQEAGQPIPPRQGGAVDDFALWEKAASFASVQVFRASTSGLALPGALYRQTELDLEVA
jgi:hypothetical protein